MKYSINIKGEGLVFAQSYDVNASYKHLGAACDAIRYVNAEKAIQILDNVIGMERAIPFRRHNRHMGSRSELGGRKGAYPVKAASEVRKTLVNAMANASNKGLDGEGLFVVHASANKTHIESRYPSKGSIAWGRGMYGRSAINHSDLEYAKVEIVLAERDTKGLTHNMKYFIGKKEKELKLQMPEKKAAKPAPKKLKAEQKKPEPAKKMEQKAVEKPKEEKEAENIATKAQSSAQQQKSANAEAQKMQQAPTPSQTRSEAGREKQE